jgi:hypothetical protein
MANLVVDRNSLPQVIEEWLKAIGVKEGDKLQMVFLPEEVIIRPESAENTELDAWFDETAQKFDSALRRLAS